MAFADNLTDGIITECAPQPTNRLIIAKLQKTLNDELTMAVQVNLHWIGVPKVAMEFLWQPFHSFPFARDGVAIAKFANAQPKSRPNFAAAGAPQSECR